VRAQMVLKYGLTRTARFPTLPRMHGITVSKKLRSELDAMRLKHRLTFAEIARIAGMSDEVVRQVIRNGRSVRDTHLHALTDVVEKYQRGELTFEDGKAVEKSVVA
jgi:hypothetical protein